MRRAYGFALLLALSPACASPGKSVKSAGVRPDAAPPKSAASDSNPPGPLSVEETGGKAADSKEPRSNADEPASGAPSASSSTEPALEEAPQSEPTNAAPILIGPPPDPSKALPELVMRHVGMHIGGESNSAESKKPFLDAIEKRKKNILFCYREVSDPKVGGTFGVDLRIAVEGGAPEVRKLRHKLGGFEFDGCMHKAFESMRFPALPRATMVSYSLRFEFKEKKR